MPNILAIDQGTSATKAIVVATDGRVLGSGEAPVRPAFLADGGVEQDPDALWESVVTAGKTALAGAREPVAAVGLANQGETVLAWDRTTGRPLSNAISWQDRRAGGICERLAADTERLVEITGLPLDPYFAAPKMRWLREHVTRDGVVTTTDTWLLHRLTGAFVTDVATASRTMLLDLGAGRWSPEACDLFELNPNDLPAIVGNAESIGETTVFGQGVPVTAAIVDQQAALFAHGCHAPGSAKCTYGTGAFLLANVGAEPRRSTAGLAACMAWRLRDDTAFCLDGQAYTVGAAVSWLEKLGLIGKPDDLDTAAPTSTAQFVPALAGLGAPFWKPHAHGAFVGLSLATARADLVRAVIDGIAAQVTWLARAVAYDLGSPLVRLRVDGGLTRSKALLQTQADLLQAPVDVYPSPDATAFGIAALARLGAGLATTPGGGRRQVDAGRNLHATNQRRRSRSQASRLASRRRSDHGSPALTYDVAIIGAGVVGTAIARELAQYELRIVLLEAGDDVGIGTSKANTAILHTGFDAKPGTLEARLVRRGHALLMEHGPERGIPIEKTGALLVAWTPEQQQALGSIAGRAAENGYTKAQAIEAAELYEKEPHLGPGATGALAIPDEHIICPFTPPLAFATEAVMNGVTLRLKARVGGVTTTPDAHTLETTGGRVDARFVVNAAGLHSDTIDRLFGHDRFIVTPRRGELIVFDKLARTLVHHTILPVPTATTKGVLVAPTTFGNVVLGPTAEDVPDRTATGTTAAGLASLLDKGARILPALVREEVTASYVGLRAATEHGDFQIAFHPDARYVCVGGIRSTGLTASMAIAEHVAEGLADAGVHLERRRDFRTITMPNVGEAFPRPYRDAARITGNPDYGRIVCHCERTTRGEILDAMRSAIPPRTLDGLRRRTRAGFGRCQGFYCMAEVSRLLADASGQPLETVLGTKS